MDIDIPDGSVVVGMDASTSARRALAWAADLAHRERRILCLVHSVEVPVASYQGYGGVSADMARWRGELNAWVDRDLREAGEEVMGTHAGLDVRRFISNDDARATLGEASGRASVVVVGTRGHGRVARMILGSVSEYVARYADCPVVVVHEALGDGPVVAGIGNDWSTTPVLEFAFHQASVWNQDLRVVHVAARTEDTSFSPDDARGGRLRLAESIAGFREKYPDVAAPFEVLTPDDPEFALVDASRTSSLLVVGRGSRGRIREIIDPPVAAAVLERAVCPVAVVPIAAAVS